MDFTAGLAFFAIWIPLNHNIGVWTAGQFSAACFPPLRQNSLHHVPRHVGQAEIAAAVAIGQLGVIDAQQMQDGGVQIVRMDGLVHRLEAEIVGRAVGRCRLSLRRRPAAVEKPWLLWSRPFCTFTRPLASTAGVRPNSPPIMHERLLQQPARLQILEQRRDRLVRLSASLR